MPKKPTDYTRTVIYKIEHNDNKELVYVGSTTDFTKRKYSHKNSCYNQNERSYSYKVYNMIRENGGWESFQMLEIKKYPCNDANEARAEEERCRVELKATLNSIKAFAVRGETRYDWKIYHKTIVASVKKWREANPEKYRIQRNKDYVNEKRWTQISREFRMILL